MQKVYHIFSKTFEFFIKHILDIVFGFDTHARWFETLSADEAWHTLPASSLRTDHTYALFLYKDSRVKMLVKQVKYKNNKVCVQLCGALLYKGFIDAMNNLLSDKNSDGFTQPLVVSVPLHRARLAERGFDQNALLARALYTESTKPESIIKLQYVPDILIKKHPTPTQTSLKKREQRLQNLCDAFAVSILADIRGRNIILIDDVTTTGTTLHECRRVLMSAGARRVFSLAVAH